MKFCLIDGWEARYAVVCPASYPSNFQVPFGVCWIIDAGSPSRCAVTHSAMAMFAYTFA